MFALISRLAGAIAGGVLLAAALSITIDVLLRWAIAAPIKGLFEISELAFAGVLALAFTSANYQRSHVSMEIVSNFTGRIRGVSLVADILTAGAFALFPYFLLSHAAAKSLYGETTLVLGISIGPIWYGIAGLLAISGLAQLAAVVEDIVALAQEPAGEVLRELLAPALALVAVASALLFLIANQSELGPLAKVLLGFAALYLLALSHVPIGVAMTLTGLAGAYALLGIEPSALIGANNLVGTLSSADLASIPLFLLMGNLAVSAGAADDIFEAAALVFGRFRGGHAIATVIGCAGFGAISGSSVATTATLGGVAFREMKSRSYAPTLATGSIAAGGTLGALIPPSVILIIYCVIVEQPISEAFIAALVPGLLAVLLYTIAILILVRVRPDLAPPADKEQPFAPARAILHAWRPILLFLSIVIGLYGGLFTVQEAAAVGTGFAFVFWLVSGRASFSGLIEAVCSAVGGSAVLYLLIIGASIFGAFLNLAGVTTAILSVIDPEIMPVWIILGILVVMYLLLGSVFDTVAALVVTVPFVIPIIQALGYDLIWWGVVTLTLVEIGMITPPIGMNVFVMKSLIADEVSIRSIFKGVVPFLMADGIRLLLLLGFPVITLWLPTLLR